METLKNSGSNRKLLNEMFNCDEREKNWYNLKQLHEAIGIDYNKPFEMFRECGKFTINQVLKIHSITDKQVMFVFMNSYGLHFAQISSDGVLKIDVNNQTRFHKFYAKSHFEKCRKKNEVAYFIICNKEDLRPTSTSKNPYNYHNQIRKFFKNGNLNTRFEIENIIMGISNKVAEEWISAFDLSLRGAKNKGYVFLHLDEILPFRLDRTTSPRTTSDVIDKSGYNVAIKRYELQRKASIVKAENDKNRLKHADFSSENKEIEKELNKIKNSLVEKMQSCSIFEHEKLTKIGKMLYFSFDSLCKGYKTHLEKIDIAKKGE